MYIRGDGLIKYQFYEKPYTSMFAVPSYSAHSSKINKSVLVEEGCRRMRNFARGLDDQVVIGVMGRLATKLERSGYP